MPLQDKRLAHGFRRVACIILGFCYFSPGLGWGQRADQLLLVVNSASPQSMEVANYYAHSRGLPEKNRLELMLPRYQHHPERAMPMNDFWENLWRPIQESLRNSARRGITAVLFSMDFPVAIQGQQLYSLQGLLLHAPSLQGARPRPKALMNPLYRPSPDGVPGTLSSTAFTQEVAQHRLLPSMMLAVGGLRGEEKAGIIQRLLAHPTPKCGKADGTFWFITGSGIRAQVRAKQFAPVVDALKAMDYDARIGFDYPTGPRPVLGLLCGAQKISPNTYSPLAAGAYADHLTSHAANFGDPHQDKLSRWLEAGAAGSSGTVTEPGATWLKFPTASIMLHYARGASLLEALYQSVHTTYQLCMVGDPLCRPFGEGEATPKKPERSFDELLLPELEGEPVFNLKHPVRLQVEVEGGMHSLNCLRGQIIVGESGRDEDGNWWVRLDPSLLGVGPSQVHLRGQGDRGHLVGPEYKIWVR